MKEERLIILLGLLIALVFFYIGLNQWLKTKEEKTQPLPVVVTPKPKQEEAPQKMESQEQKKEEKPVEKDLIAQKIREEKDMEKPKEKQAAPMGKATQKPTEKQVAKLETKNQKEGIKKEVKKYTVQVGAFIDKERAHIVAKKAESMGYKVSIIEEDNFYKVRLIVSSGDISTELNKLKKTFGGAILVR